MNKFFAYGFFILNVIFLAFLLIGNDLLFKHNFMWVFLILFLLFYGGFVVYTLLNLLFTFKRFAFVERIRNYFPNVSPSVLGTLNFIESALYFGVTILALGFLFYSGGLLATNSIFVNYKESLKSALYTLSQGGGSLENDVSKLKTKLSNLEMAANGDRRSDFLKRNLPTYFSGDDRFTYALEFYRISDGFGNDRVAEYAFYAYLKNKPKTGDYPNTVLVTGSNMGANSHIYLQTYETIEMFTAKRYEIQTFTHPVFLIAVKTNLRSFEVVAYPTKLGGEDQWQEYNFIYPQTQSYSELGDLVGSDFRSRDLKKDGITFDLYLSDPYTFDSVVGKAGIVGKYGAWVIASDAGGAISAIEVFETPLLNVGNNK